MSDHPEVICSQDKETNFFIYTKYKTNARPLSEYALQWPDYKNEKIIMEASPGYFYGGNATATEIKDKCNNPKILVMLREPADRLYSFFQRKKEMLFLPEDISLEKYIAQCNSYSDAQLVEEKNHMYTGVVFGHYSKHLNEWYQAFGSNLRVSFFDDLREPRKFMKELSTWLGIDASFYDTYNFDVKNKSGKYKNKLIHTVAVKLNFGLQRFWRNNPQLKKKLRDTYYSINRGNKKVSADDSETIVKNKLREHYKPYNKQLADILTKNGITKLPGWLQN
ncbi:MAG: sulfotransferase domain-containing protein [Bacteroidetes bacterium]|nr:sulfotransferase domain-containing protein [Bacteroidota bacterium]